MLRFEFEQKMLTGDIAVGDIPAAWNERMKEFLGIVPELLMEQLRCV